MNPVRRSFLSKASWLWLALSLVAGTSPMLRAAPLDGSDAKGVEFFETRFARYWQTRVISATAGKARR